MVARLLFSLVILLTVTDAMAAGTRRLLEEAKGFLEGEMEGVILDASGRLRTAAVTPVAYPTDAYFVWSVTRDARGRIVAGTGDGGTVFRQEGDTLEPWARTLSLEVLSLLPRRDGLLAGTSPDGIVYRIDDDGGVTVALDVPQQSVWALVAGDDPDSWLAGTGPGARILRVSRSQPAGEVLHDLPATNVMALLRDEGGLWIATEGPGLVLRVDGDDDATPRVVHEAEGREIRALVSDGDGGVYALELALASDDEDETPVSRITWLPAGGGREVIHEGEQRLLSLARRPEGDLLAGEAATGRILRIDRAGRRSLWVDLEDSDILALHQDDDGVLAGTGNLGQVVALDAASRDGGTFTSRVLEASHVQRWGRLRVDGVAEGVEFSVRTGVRREPDSTWSEWTDPRDVGEELQAPVAPFLQVRLTLAPESLVSGFEVAWRERNLPPRLMALKVEPAGGDLDGGRLNGSPDPVSQRFADGLGVEYSLYRERRAPDADRTAWARGLRTIVWRAEDPNGDPLRYRVEVRRFPDGPWHVLAEDHPERVLAWDTRAWEDHTYEVRVTADDRTGNPQGDGRTAELLATPVHVDNTAPELDDVEREDDGTLRFTGRDRGSPLVEASLRTGDAEDWVRLEPRDGVLDDGEEEFTATAGPGPVWLRLVDAAGNVRVEEVRVR